MARIILILAQKYVKNVAEASDLEKNVKVVEEKEMRRRRRIHYGQKCFAKQAPPA